MGYQIPREILDQILMNQAVRKGATIIQPCRAIQPIRAGERVIGVATDRGEFFSDWVVDATGRKNWLARHLKLGFEKRSNRKVVSYGYVESTDTDLHLIPLFRFKTDGWTWIARTTDRTIAWVRLYTDSARKPYERPTELASFSDTGEIHYANMTWRTSKRVAGDGWCLVGDAADVLDPSSSRGVLKAAMNGIMVAHLLEKSFEGALTRHQLQSYFQRWMRESFEKQTQDLAQSSFGGAIK